MEPEKSVYDFELMSKEGQERLGELKWAVEDMIDWYTRPGRLEMPATKMTLMIGDNAMSAVYLAYKLGLEKGKNESRNLPQTNNG